MLTLLKPQLAHKPLSRVWPLSAPAAAPHSSIVMGGHQLLWGAPLDPECRLQTQTPCGVSVASVASVEMRRPTVGRRCRKRARLLACSLARLCAYWCRHAAAPTSPCPTARPQQGPRPDVVQSPTRWVRECECLVWQNRQRMNQSHMVAARQVTSCELMGEHMAADQRP